MTCLYKSTALTTRLDILTSGEFPTFLKTARQLLVFTQNRTVWFPLIITRQRVKSAAAAAVLASIIQLTTWPRHPAAPHLMLNPVMPIERTLEIFNLLFLYQSESREIKFLAVS